MRSDEPEGLRQPPVGAVERRDGAVVIRLQGELDLYNSGEMGETLASEAETAERVVIDLAQVDFVDSTALGALVEARRKLDAKALYLAAPAPEVRRALEVSGLVAYFDVFDSVEDALASST